MRPDAWTLALQAVNFLVLVWLLHRFLWRPVQAMLDRRAAALAAEREAAASVRRGAEAATQAIAQERVAMGAERDRILDEAHRQAEADRKELLDRTTAEADRRLAEANARIEEERRAVLDDLRRLASKAAVDVARSLVGRVAADGPSAMLLEAALDSLRALPKPELSKLEREISDAGCIRIVTAEPLPPEGCARCRSELAELIGAAAKVEFVDDPALIAGVEIHFPHFVLRQTWRDALDEAGEALEREPVAS